MAQPQSQVPQMPARPFSPATPAQSPAMAQQGLTQAGLTLPPNKRPRLSPVPAPSLPASPYPAQQYASSPGASPIPTNAASPSYPSMAPQAHTAPYQNGNMTPSLHLPDARQGVSSAPSTQITPAVANQYTPAILAPMAAPSTPTPATPGVMGPPSKPAERPTKEYDYDPADLLAGTGIDIRSEEQALADYYAGSFGQDARYGFPANAPGSRTSFYGAGPANQPAQPADGKTQQEMERDTAERVWRDSARNLAAIRSNEVANPFCVISVLHRKARDIAKHHDLELNLDLKNPAQPMGRMKAADAWPTQPTVTVSTKTGPDGAFVRTSGSWIPHDAFLVDQLALLSLATKHRLRDKLEDASHVAAVRQTTSHGEVPAGWSDVAAPIVTAESSATQDASPRPGWESALSPRTNPLKRSFEASNAQSGSATDSARISTTNHLATAVREYGRGDRDQEEARLRKRRQRANPEAATSGSRAGSVVPGTPGSTAAEPEKVLTKKEQKELKKASASGKGGARGGIGDSTATANQTLAHLMGGFGGRKKGKQYAWMTTGATSGATTPTRLQTQDLPGTPSAVGGRASVQNRMTHEGKQRLGMWREDGEKGKQIQLRDWVTVLEMDGIDLKAIQDAYIKLDSDLLTTVAT